MRGRCCLLFCFTTVRRLERLSFFEEIGKEGGCERGYIDLRGYITLV